MTPDTKAALDMLAAFASVGVSHFDVTLKSLSDEKAGYRPARSIDALRQILAALLIDTTGKQQSVIIRPHKPAGAELVQLDDLKDDAAAKLAPFAFMLISTSPGNGQAWVAVKDAPEDFARRLKKGTKADDTASGATRISGSLNFKAKYAPDFPLVTITHTQPGNIVTAAALEQAGLVAPVERPTPPRVSQQVSSGRIRGRRRWPSWLRCVQNAPPVNDGDRPDISRADFVWCMTALDWGWTRDQTAAQLMEVSSKARENGEKYAILTATNAEAAVARRNGLKSAPEPR